MFTLYIRSAGVREHFCRSLCISALLQGCLLSMLPPLSTPLLAHFHSSLPHLAPHPHPHPATHTHTCTHKHIHNSPELNQGMDARGHQSETKANAGSISQVNGITAVKLEILIHNLWLSESDWVCHEGQLLGEKEWELALGLPRISLMRQHLLDRPIRQLLRCYFLLKISSQCLFSLFWKFQERE